MLLPEIVCEKPYEDKQHTKQHYEHIKMLKCIGTQKNKENYKELLGF